MGGKGRRRREKNFLAAHGGHERLPPAPKASQIEALPFKLRRIMDLKNPAPNPGSSRISMDVKDGRKKGGVVVDRKVTPKDEYEVTTAEPKERGNKKNVLLRKHKDDGDEITDANTDDKRKAKRKRKSVNDLRFQTMTQDLAAYGLKKRDRKNKYLEARKKKHKKAKPDGSLEFPGREEIKFGEVVEAPPKLSFPKVSKPALDASHERVRLKAVEAYRSRKGWISRPGIHLPPITETMSS